MGSIFHKSFLTVFMACALAAPLTSEAQETETALPAYDAETRNSFEELCKGLTDTSGRVVCADIVAMDQTLVYNRFGSHNPFGMIFALNRDVVPLRVPGLLSAPEDASQQVVDLVADLSSADRDPLNLSAEACATQLGTESRPFDVALSAGQVRLRDCKRPRPMVLRVKTGDQLLVNVTNLLAPSQSPDFSKEFCRNTEDVQDYGRKAVHEATAFGNEGLVSHSEADCKKGKPDGKAERDAEPNWPNTRGVNFVAQGMLPLPLNGNAPHPACFGTGSVAPGESFQCLLQAGTEGVNFFASHAAPSGGEGNGGSLTHGLFGAVVIQKPGSSYYRSQVTQAALDYVWPVEGDLPNRKRVDTLKYDELHDGMPVLNMLRKLGDSTAKEIVHTDLNAIIYCDAAADGAACSPAPQAGAADVTLEPAYSAFREFSVFFHDELKTFYTKNFRELGQFGQLTGVKDGFAINYGASGMGSLLLANRKGIGPADDCMECLYEEFFLTSWANGDPALLEWYPDDPSNVHHSYMNDPVVFRNFHAGPKETHVFHLHAHQWFAGNDPNRGAYLDSQTVGPQQGFTYNIYHGGLRGPGDEVAGKPKGWWDTQGSGNRNRTVGDSIFHCHLYPHFAQGMWALWRVHDVLEDGTRLLPDGQAYAGLSVDFTLEKDRPMSRAGSVDRDNGSWLGGLGSGGKGTPVPAIVPLPGEALPVMPTYAASTEVAAVADDEGDGEAKPSEAPLPGYPFYIAGEEGHRPPQAPLDIARNLGAPMPGSATMDDRSGVD